MGSGQSLLTLVAMMILSVITIKVNGNLLTAMGISQNSKFGLEATSLATSKIEAANRLYFDEATKTSAPTSVSQLTAPSSLGVDAGETANADSTFDDFDDYNNYSSWDSTMLSAKYLVQCKVGYVNANAPDVIVATQTWHKKLTVTVSSPSMSDTIRLSCLFSYWVFR
jgi:hypothetical protein